MGCWTDFAPFVTKHIPDVRDDELSIATLQAAINLGAYLRGFTNTYVTQISSNNPSHDLVVTGTNGRSYGGWTHDSVEVVVGLPTGFRLTHVSSVRLNGTYVDRESSARRVSCSQFRQTECGVEIMPAPIDGCTAEIAYLAAVIPGETGRAMPDFLYTTYMSAMLPAILAEVFRMRSDNRSAAVYEREYTNQRAFVKASRPKNNARLLSRRSWL